MPDQLDFIISAQIGDINGVRHLLNVPGMNINYEHYSGVTPLLGAISSGNIEIVRLLLGAGANANHENVHGQIGLSVAALRGHAEILRLLLTLPGTDINHANIDGNTPLMLAAEKGHAEIVKILLDAGADIHHINNDGKTARQLAEDNEHEAAAALLRKSEQTHAATGLAYVDTFRPKVAVAAQGPRHLPNNVAKKIIRNYIGGKSRRRARKQKKTRRRF